MYTIHSAYIYIYSQGLLSENKHVLNKSQLSIIIDSKQSLWLVVDDRMFVLNWEVAANPLWYSIVLIGLCDFISTGSYTDFPKNPWDVMGCQVGPRVRKFAPTKASIVEGQ